LATGVGNTSRAASCALKRHAAISGRNADPSRTSSVPSPTRASPIISVLMRKRVRWYSRSHASIASHRSSSGDRFHRLHDAQITQNRPLALSNARRRPTGKHSMTSLRPRSAWQKRHEEYTGIQDEECGLRFRILMKEHDGR